MAFVAGIPPAFRNTSIRLHKGKKRSQDGAVDLRRIHTDVHFVELMWLYVYHTHTKGSWNHEDLGAQMDKRHPTPPLGFCSWLSEMLRGLQQQSLGEAATNTVPKWQQPRLHWLLFHTFDPGCGSQRSREQGWKGVGGGVPPRWLLPTSILPSLHPHLYLMGLSLG